MDIPAEELVKYRDYRIFDLWDFYIDYNNLLTHGIKNPGSQEDEGMFTLIEELHIVYSTLNLRSFDQKQSLIRDFHDRLENAVDAVEYYNILSEIEYFKHEFWNNKLKSH